MDIRPINPGHVLVIPNEHAAHLKDLEPTIGAHLFTIAQRIAISLQQGVVKAEGVNFFLADGTAAGQEVPHIHLHVFPRFQGDGFKLQFNPASQKRPSRTTLDEMAQQLSHEMSR